jgi:hypothetical protein
VDRDIVNGIVPRPQSSVSDADTTIISVLDMDDDSTALVYCNLRLEEQSRITFARREGESEGTVWYTDSSMNVITSYYSEGHDYAIPDTLCIVERRFDNSTKKLIGRRELMRLVDKKHKKHYGVQFSADRQYMLGFVYEKYEDAGDDEQLWNAQLFLVQANTAEVQKIDIGIIVSEDYANDYNPVLAVGNNGDIFYTFTRDNGDTLAQQSVVRLNIAQNRVDTLMSSYSKITSYAMTVFASEPGKPQLQILGDTVLVVYPHFGGKNLDFITVGKFDFGTKRSLFNTIVRFDEETCNHLISRWTLPNFKLQESIALFSGEVIVVLQQSIGYLSSIDGYMIKAGPLVVVKIGKNGEVQWESSVIQLTVSQWEEKNIACHTTDTSFCLLYRNRDADEGIVLSEFLLTDGRSRWKELPVTFAQLSSLYPDKTFWLKDTLVVFGAEAWDSPRICLHIIPSGKYTWFDQETARRIVGNKKITE